MIHNIASEKSKPGRFKRRSAFSTTPREVLAKTTWVNEVRLHLAVFEQIGFNNNVLVHFRFFHNAKEETQLNLIF